jgi:hypothetical protein
MSERPIVMMIASSLLLSFSLGAEFVFKLLFVIV